MAWYDATIVIGIERVADRESELMVHEEIYLFEASTAVEARRLAVIAGKEIEQLDDNLTIEGEPARRFFAGVSRVVQTQNIVGAATGRPENGCEVMYQEYTVQSRKDLIALLNGNSVCVTRTVGEY